MPFCCALRYGSLWAPISLRRVSGPGPGSGTGHVHGPGYVRRFGQLRPSDSYQSVSVLCGKCKTRLFKYKKKNGTKSRLVKLYVERIVSDPYQIVDKIVASMASTSTQTQTQTQTQVQVQTQVQTQMQAQVQTQVSTEVQVGNPGGEEAEGTEGEGEQGALTCPCCASQWGRCGELAGHSIFKIIGGRLTTK
jgi:hypothetical protein